jgi:hypothetical protein
MTNWLQKDIEESKSRLRSTDGDWEAPILAELGLMVEAGGGSKLPTNVWLMSVVASGVKYIIGDGQNLPWYSSWGNITVAIVPLAYSGSGKWIVTTVSTTVCGVWGWTYCDVVGWHPMPLVAKKHSWWMTLSTLIRVNHDVLSSTTWERYVSSDWSFLTRIWSSISECKSNL